MASGELYAVADFCLIPMGTGESSVAEYIAECARVLEKSGLKYKMHGYGTNIEGPWSEVTQAIQACHTTDIRIGTRVDRDIVPGTGNESKVARVEQILAESR
ncbi:YkoF-like protein [Epithele typhae]|uniref:YkoF-like protein n=1 Tax=Epithele typhae TaxID=378194 RepID=UPI00200839B7|nr:YkoF-like protein [Epithele typhae]KAH9945790.1 YkoF-like protein [Epithele typhae]